MKKKQSILNSLLPVLLVIKLIFTLNTAAAQGSYCSASSTTFSYEWIKQVSVGTMSNSSAGSRYTDFSTGPNRVQPTTVLQGASVSYSLLPGFSGTTYPEQWAIFIDFNQNGSFTDADERVVSVRSTTANAVLGTFSIPRSAPVTTTRMRVVMQYGNQPNPCGSFSYGEVEDYSITISALNTPTPSVTPLPATPTSAASCTPPPCGWPNTLSCPTGNCPGGCGFTCVPPTPTIIPPTSSPTPGAQCTPPPCSAPGQLTCPTGNCSGGCGYVCAGLQLPPGALDPTFGTAGRVNFPISSGVTITRAVLQSDGKFILGGVLGTQTGIDRDENRRGTLFIARFLPNGTTDPTFGVSGFVAINFGAFDNKARFKDLILQSDGKVLILAQANNNQNFQESYLWRYNGNGVVDPTFGVNGRVGIYPVFVTPQSLALQSDGKILVAGDSATTGPASLRVARLLSNGTKDSTFGVSGEFRRETSVVRYTQVVTTSVNGEEKILVTALIGSAPRLTLIRLNSTGSVDQSFGVSGTASHTIDPNYLTLYGYTLSKDGRGFSFGESMPTPTYSNNYYIARTKVLGALDETFGAATGIVQYPWGGVRLPRHLFVQSGPVSSQSSSEWPRTLISVAGTDGARIDRLSSIGAPDTSFGNAGSVMLPAITSGGRLLEVMNGSRLLVVGASAQGLVIYRMGL